MKKPQPIRLLVADDHLIVRLGLVTLIERQRDMRVVAEASSGRQAVELFAAHHPDVTLMDLRMPGLGGVEAIETIRAQDPQARIIILTIHKGDEAVYRALRAGAQGYLLKDVPGEEIVTAIRMVHSGQACIPPDIAARFVEHVRYDALTPREVYVLKLLAKGLSNLQIASQLQISAATVKNHVASVLGKLGVESRTHAVTLALERNLIDLEDAPAGTTGETKHRGGSEA